jgi:uncharacterized protein (DUF2235 family)
MPKDIVILLDGTSNGIAAQRTNILRLYGCLRKSPEQLVYYDPGVGTLGADGAWSRLWQTGHRTVGHGHGLGHRRQCQTGLPLSDRAHYDSGKATGGGARPHLSVRFSRGAYTARMLAGFIHTIGLIDRAMRI